jgi:hypothetical protein
MSAVLRLGPETRRRLRDASPAAAASFPGERERIGSEAGAAPRGPALPGFPLSPLEQEILSICLNAPEDPRDVGMLPAMLSAERRRKAPASAAPPDAPAP